MPALWDYENARVAGGSYDRPFFERFQWGMIEKTPGNFDFYEPDRAVTDAQSCGLHILANIQPFAPWDQEICHGSQLTDTGLPGVQCTRYKPCDMEAYANFVIKLVERYDGDGIDDMPCLTVPIKHWELMNEPEFQTDPIYFQGTPADYVDTLKVTYEAVKQADPGALIVQGGMAGMFEQCTDFWQGVFDAGGGDYIDIMNMHSIGHGEHLNIPAFKQFLEDNNLGDKPIWVTEVQYQQAQQTQGYTNEEFAKILARSYIFALANGVDKLFYVNIRMPPGDHLGTPFDERSALITDDGELSSMFYAHLTISDILGALDLDDGDTVEIIKETVDDWFIVNGQYKFTVGGRTVYALWGSGSLPAEITGEVRVIDITGTETIVDVASIHLTDSPIFILLD
ncbi:MAG: hypothetical protein JW845_09320 [Dehalococcoidales bacterium]|nr:hypothetical protein [Dehalococcoidales bacterium]